MALALPFLALFSFGARGHLNNTLKYEFHNPNALPAPLTGIAQLYGDRSCIQVASDFPFKSIIFPGNSVTLECVNLYSGAACTGREQKMLSRSTRRERLRFKPRSFKSCLPVSSPKKGRPSCKPVGPLTQDQLERIGLVMHNQYRRRHGVPPLTINPSLSTSAQDYANELVRRNQFRHSDSDDEYGENLAFFRWDIVRNEREAVTMAIDRWYDEMRDPGFDFKKPSFHERTGHFSQLIWRDNFEMGIGAAYNRVICAYVIVVHYRPGGNTDSVIDFVRNVPPPLN